MICRSYEIIPRPVVLPTVIGTVIREPGDALTIGSETGIGGVPVGVAVGVNVGVIVVTAVPVGVSVAVAPLTVTLPFVVNAGGTPSLKEKPGWNPMVGSV